ncbi:MAG: hypothetical protein ACREOF_06780 [Gemmatimonadales bacterium]
MPTRTMRSPARRSDALSGEPVEIDGMEVIEDKRVTLFPVTLLELPGSTPEDSKRRG